MNGPDRPSFVLIMTDSQATNVIGAYGHPELRTPRIDGLARAGVTFDRAYTASPLCTPARAALFTGRYPHGVGAWTNGLSLASGVRHLGQRFSDGGYRCAYVGKWHLDGHDYFGSGVCPDGWDPEHWFDGRRYLDGLDADQKLLMRKGVAGPEDLLAADIPVEWTWGRNVSDRAIRFLERSQDATTPFVLVVSFDEPHDPYMCPSEFVEPFMDYRYPLGPAAFDDLRGKPLYQQQWARMCSGAEAGGWLAPLAEQQRRVTREPGHAIHPMYFGCNSFVDSEIGRVLDAVDRYAPASTYVIYTSDHGEMLGSHGLCLKGPVVYDEVARIPLIVRPPLGATDARAGSRVETSVSHVDVLPTLLDLAHLPIPPALEGSSLAALLAGGPEDPARAVFIEFGRYELAEDHFGGFYPMRAIVKGEHKLSINLLDEDELYDVGDDPAEVHNRIRDPGYAPVRDLLHDELLDWMHRSRDPFRSPAFEARSWRGSKRFGWSSQWDGIRVGFDDGYEPPRLNYRTGQPLRGRPE